MSGARGILDDAPGAERPALVIGGAGFVGSNLADRLLRDGREVVVFDTLARPGVERNLAWLRAAHGERVTFVRGDVRDRDAVREAVRDGGGAGAAGDVYHFAAQVAVTTSLGDPGDDFDVNARGTLNVLEAVRALRDETGYAAPVLFTSTNKVYGELSDVAEARSPGGARRYEPADAALAATGIAESRPLDFHSPYGCSKGAADQYVCDYARSFGLPTVVFRMSCIYGPRQFGTEDQGWVAHFLIRALGGGRSRSTATGCRCATCCSSTTSSTPSCWRGGTWRGSRAARSTSAAGRRTPRRCSSWWSASAG
jgi:CDP-paratose 2-epimerase